MRGQLHKPACKSKKRSEHGKKGFPKKQKKCEKPNQEEMRSDENQKTKRGREGENPISDERKGGTAFGHFSRSVQICVPLELSVAEPKTPSEN